MRQNEVFMRLGPNSALQMFHFPIWHRWNMLRSTENIKISFSQTKTLKTTYALMAPYVYGIRLEKELINATEKNMAVSNRDKKISAAFHLWIRSIELAESDALLQVSGCRRRLQGKPECISKTFSYSHSCCGHSFDSAFY